MSTTGRPNPGSKEAVAAGCTCPVLDNAHGKGWMGLPGIFVKNEHCPLHGIKPIEWAAGPAEAMPPPPKPDEDHP